MIIKGTAHKYGDHIDTDVIIPARYLNINEPEQLAAHCLEDLDADFVEKVKPSDILVAGENFGCGSSREHAPIAIKAAGVGCVIAESFARIFFRNALNIGLPIVEAPGATDMIGDGDDIEVDLQAGTVRNITKGAQFDFAPLTGMARELVDSGGLKPLVRRRLRTD